MEPYLSFNDVQFESGFLKGAAPSSHLRISRPPEALRVWTLGAVRQEEPRSLAPLLFSHPLAVLPPCSLPRNQKRWQPNLAREGGSSATSPEREGTVTRPTQRSLPFFPLIHSLPSSSPPMPHLLSPLSLHGVG